LIHIALGTEKECLAQESTLETDSDIDMQQDLEEVGNFLDKENIDVNSLPSPPLVP